MIVEVKFKNKSGYLSNKIYWYNVSSKLSLHKGFTYKIVADYDTTYNNPIIVTNVLEGYSKNLRTITSIETVDAPPVKYFHESIYVNEDKRTIVVKWKDGTTTKMKPQDIDEFDIEKGIALCFMKKMHDNRGAYNNIFREAIYFENDED